MGILTDIRLRLAGWANRREIERRLKLQFQEEVLGGVEDPRSVESLARQEQYRRLGDLFYDLDATHLEGNLKAIHRMGLPEPLHSALIDKLRTYHSWRTANQDKVQRAYSQD